MAKFELIEGGQPEQVHAECDPDGTDFSSRSVSPLSPEQLHRLWLTGRDNQELDEYEALLKGRVEEDITPHLRIVEGEA